MDKKVQQIKQILGEAGIEVVIKKFPESTRTAQEAASVIGCTLGQIAKSLVFKGKDLGKPILIIASGSNGVDEKKINEFLNEEINKADADFVYQQTGFAIGGVPPFGHKTALTTFIDQDLLQYNEIWAAAGTGSSVFRITPKALIEITKGKALDLKS